PGELAGRSRRAAPGGRPDPRRPQPGDRLPRRARLMSSPVVAASLSGLFGLQGKTAVVIGASRGLGLHLAGCLGRAGADLVLAARSTEDVDRAAAGLRAGGIAVQTARVDVSDPANVEEALGSVPRIDILVNAAGVPNRG